MHLQCFLLQELVERERGRERETMVLDLDMDEPYAGSCMHKYYL